MFPVGSILLELISRDNLRACNKISQNVPKFLAHRVQECRDNLQVKNNLSDNLPLLLSRRWAHTLSVVQR